MNRNLTLLPLGTLMAVVSLAAIPDPVKTDSGPVAGTSNQDASVRMFKGIPFAAPPVGDLRWKAAQPPAKWEGVKMATEFSPTCSNGAAGRGRGGAAKGGAPKGGTPAGPAPSEDCLYINVWTPAKSAGDKLPVMVWTYGGGFTGGYGSDN